MNLNSVRFFDAVSETTEWEAEWGNGNITKKNLPAKAEYNCISLAIDCHPVIVGWFISHFIPTKLTLFFSEKQF